MDEGPRVIRQEAGATDVLARRVDLNAVGLLNVSGDTSEVLAVAALREIDGDDPFEAVAGRAAEEHLGLEVFVVQQLLEQGLNIGQVVEVEAQEAGVLLQLVFLADRKGAGKSAVVEALGLEETCPARIPYHSEVFCASSGIAAGDVFPDFVEGNLAIRDGVADGSLEERETGQLEDELASLRRRCRLCLQVEMQLVVEELQQFFAGFLEVELRKVEEAAVGDVSGGVVVAGDAR